MKKTKILNITFIALFAALSYISLMLFFFPFAGMFIHFGNLIVVVAALLVGGWQGGLAGSIGMGLYDLLNGHADSSPKTFLLKFLIGLTVGLVYNYFKNSKRNTNIALIISGTSSISISAALILYSIFGNGNFNGRVNILSPIFAIIGVICLLFPLLKTKFPQKTSAAIIGAVCGMGVNIFGELAWKTVQFWMAGSDFSAAFTSSLLTQGSTLINAGVSVIGGVALFLSLEKPFEKILKD